MTDLRKATSETAAALRRAEQDYTRLTSIHKQLGERRQTVWNQLPAIAGRLEAVATLFDARDEATKQLSDLKQLPQASRPTEIVFNGLEVRFDVVRLFRFQSYTTTFWSLYDSLWASVLPIVKNNQSTSLLGHCVTGNTSRLGGPADALSRLYGWSVGFFYSVRNDLVHDAANALDPSAVFLSPEKPSDFEVSDSFLVRMKKDNQKWSLNEQMSLRAGWPWSRDLAVLLNACSEDTDQVFRHFLTWSTEVLKRGKHSP